MKSAPASASPLPLVIQLGFAGTRELYDAKAHPKIDRATFETDVAHQLADLLKHLRSTLNLPANSHVFFCGLSQIAIGGDMVFAEACKQSGILQRIFLPLPLGEYLAAQGSKGPDFSTDQQMTARTLLGLSHVIQTRVVSDADDRHQRFREVNLEIARVSDVVLCLVRSGQEGKAGGTQELADMASRRGRPVITLEVGVGLDGKPVISRPNEETEKTELAEFRPPSLPPEFASVEMTPIPVQPLPSCAEYIKVLKDANSAQANQLRSWFKWAALIIVLGHVVATVLAVVALKVHHGVAFILGFELLLLGLGLVVHIWLHHSHSLGRWAACRLAAEIARSLQAIGKLPVYLQHFFTLPFPPEFRRLLRTLSVMHLRDTAHAENQNWQEARCAYVINRLVDPVKKAQLPYHLERHTKAKRGLAKVHRIFYIGSVGALISTTLKLLTYCDCLPIPGSLSETCTSVFGCLAILLPVIAVAALSLALAFDLEAKEHTSSEMLTFLREQKELLEKAQSPGEVGRLIIETESRLLGETVNWHARRTYVGVA